jgi:hypothetical protein
LTTTGRAEEGKVFSVEMNAGAAFVTEKGFGHGLRYDGGAAVSFVFLGQKSAK